MKIIQRMVTRFISKTCTAENYLLHPPPDPVQANQRKRSRPISPDTINTAMWLLHELQCQHKLIQTYNLTGSTQHTCLYSN